MIYIDIDNIDFLDENGDYHRINHPAFIARERQSWFKHGKYHRLDGPAVNTYYYNYYYIDDIRHTEEEFYKKTKISKYSQKKKMSFLTTIYSRFFR